MKPALNAIAISLLVLLTISVRSAAQQQPEHKNQHIRYTVIDLGLAADRAEGINHKGGLDYTAARPDFTVHATFRRHGRKTDLGTLGGPNSTAFFGPSERGQVVGEAETPTKDPLGEDFCFYGTNLICLGFVWQNGQMTPLPILGGNNATASDINNRGEIVGWAETNTPDPTCPPPQVLQSPPVTWKNGEVHELATVSGDPDGVAVQINDKGQVAGASGNCTTPFHALLWDEDGHVKDLGNLGGTVNQAAGLNNRGQVVGASNLTGDATGHAFLWTEEHGMKDLGTLAADFGSFAFSINDTGQVVGLSNDANGSLRAFLWQDGVMTDLNAIIPPSFPFVLVEAFDINARREIVGLAVDPNTDEGHAYLAVPCDQGHADTKGCKDEGAVAVQSDTSERPKVTLSERARKLLWQHIGGRYRITPPSGMTTQTAAESATEQPVSCLAQSSTRQSGEPAAASATTDSGSSILVHGSCWSPNGQTLNGYCIGPYPFDHNAPCRAASDPRQCPSGAKAISPEQVSWGYFCRPEADAARPCAFTLR